MARQRRAELDSLLQIVAVVTLILDLEILDRSDQDPRRSDDVTSPTAAHNSGLRRSCVEVGSAFFYSEENLRKLHPSRADLPQRQSA